MDGLSAFNHTTVELKFPSLWLHTQGVSVLSGRLWWNKWETEGIRQVHYENFAKTLYAISDKILHA